MILKVRVKGIVLLLWSPTLRSLHCEFVVGPPLCLKPPTQIFWVYLLHALFVACRQMQVKTHTHKNEDMFLVSTINVNMSTHVGPVRVEQALEKRVPLSLY